MLSKLSPLPQARMRVFCARCNLGQRGKPQCCATYVFVTITSPPGSGASVSGVCTEYNGTHAPYNYSMRGADWASNKAWMCAPISSGADQAPVETVALLS